MKAAKGAEAPLTPGQVSMVQRGVENQLVGVGFIVAPTAAASDMQLRLQVYRVARCSKTVVGTRATSVSPLRCSAAAAVKAVRSQQRAEQRARGWRQAHRRVTECEPYLKLAPDGPQAKAAEKKIGIAKAKANK